MSPVHVVTECRSTRPTPDATVHRVRRLHSRWVTDLAGIRVVRPELCALHLFASEHSDRAERIVDALWSQRLLSGRSIATMLEDLGARGRNGTAGLRRYLDARGVDYTPPESGLEARVQWLLGRAGIAVDRQVSLGGDTGWTARVDFLHCTEPLVIEVQSALHHTSHTDRAADRRRIAALGRDGFTVVEITDEMVWNHPEAAVGRVKAALAAMAAMSAGAEAAFVPPDRHPASI